MKRLLYQPLINEYEGMSSRVHVITAQHKKDEAVEKVSKMDFPDSLVCIDQLPPTGNPMREWHPYGHFHPLNRLLARFGNVEVKFVR